MATKFDWVSFCTGIKNKIKQVFCSIPRPLPNGYTQDGVNWWMKNIRPEVLKIGGTPFADKIIKEDVLKGKSWLEIQEEEVRNRWANMPFPPVELINSTTKALFEFNKKIREAKPKESLSSPSQKQNTTMFQKLKQDAELLMAKIGIISARLLNYIAMAIAFGTNLLNILSGPIGEIAIKDLLPAGTDAALLEDFIMGVTKAIGYLTQSQAILGAATPDQMLQWFLQDLKNDVPGLQKSKIFAFVWNLASHLDGNAKIPSVYSYLTSKYLLKSRLDSGISADNNVAIAPVPGNTVPA